MRAVKPSSQLRRGAFTLVEMLMVIAIIAVLLAISAYAYTSAVKSGKKSATVMLLTVLQHELDARIEDTMKRTVTIPTGVTAYGTLAEAPPATPDATREKLVCSADLLRTKMPQEFSDFLEDAFTNLNNMPEQRRQYIDYYNKNFVAARHDPATQSAACLYMILKFFPLNSQSFTFDNLPPNSVQDTDGDGLLEIVDAWGKPVRFYRWPIDLVAYFIEIEQSPDWPTALRASNFDSEGKLYDGTWFPQTGAQGADPFENRNAPPLAPAAVPYSPGVSPPASPASARHRYFRLHKVYVDVTSAKTGTDNGPDTSTVNPQTYPIRPAIISAGPDGEFGLVEAPTPLGVPAAPLDQMSVRCARVDLRKLKSFSDNIISIRTIATGEK